MGMEINRFEIYLIDLDPTIGSEIQKMRPCLVISPNEINHNLRTVIVAPMTTVNRTYPTRVACRFKGKDGQIALDQIRTVDKGRLERKLGSLTSESTVRVLEVLREMFAP